jgi:REP element-mobilizing transposase RayT
MHFFDGARYELEAYAVMPNHVHILLQPKHRHTLPKILHSLKSYTGNEINKHANRIGSLWQDESYDRIVRSPEELSHFREYIRRNAEDAGVQLPMGAVYLKE